jgi:hypothetical protein
VALATRESRLGITASWVSLLGSFVLSFATWVALGELTGYGTLAFCLALCVDGYIVSALVTWMAPVSDKIATVAKVNTWIAAVIGVTAQSAYHGLTIWTQTGTAWRAVLATAVGALPPLGAAGSVHMRAMVRRNSLQLATPKVQEVMKTGVETPHPTPAEPTVPAPVSMSTAPATQELPVYVDTIREIRDQMTQRLEPVSVPVIRDPKDALDFPAMREPVPVPPVKVNGSNDASAKATDAEILNLTRQQVSGPEIARRVGKSLSTVRRTQAAARKAGEL